MKKFKILKTTKGSQTGAITEEFVKDTERDLSDDLAKIALKDKWAKPVVAKSTKADQEKTDEVKKEAAKKEGVKS